MKATAEGPVKRVSSLLVIIVLVVLVLSIAALYQAISYYGSNEIGMGSWFLFLGITGVALSSYMILQTRRRGVRLPFEPPKVITTIICEKCGLKNIRDFQRGDYIFKETEACPKCDEKMLISAIYREVKEKEKS